MKKYNCTILYVYREDAINDLMTLVLTKLGFEPGYMTVFFDEFEDPLEDIEFDESRLFSILERVPGTVTIMNQLYNETGGNYWFRLRLSSEVIGGPAICSLEWSNANLDFLLDTEGFHSLFGFDGLIYCYCYDQLDCRAGAGMEDISEHWGRSVSAKGFTVMAAPLMWFGPGFADIIQQNELLLFSRASVVEEMGHELVYVKLFDLYESPAIPENRQKQKEFWTSFDLQERIDRYAQSHVTNFEETLKARAARKKPDKEK
jgi:hypothetical protein